MGDERSEEAERRKAEEFRLWQAGGEKERGAYAMGQKEAHSSDAMAKKLFKLSQ